MAESRGPRIAVFGLGYVGCVSAVCFAKRGAHVVGVDVSPYKLQMLRSGQSPIVEESIGELTGEVVANGLLSMTEDARTAVTSTDYSLVCVGTPSSAVGSLSTKFLEQVTEQIAVGLAEMDRWHVVVFRSTMIPGTCEQLLIPRLEQLSGKRAGIDFGVCVNPEFLREGSSVKDFLNPPKTIVGARDSRSAEEVMKLYEGLPGPRYSVPIRMAEMTKYVDNSFHALKVSFANEIGAICSRLGIDSTALMQIFVSDTKLNTSPAYLKPGFSFGGSCLPKDVRALNYLARQIDVEIPLLGNVLHSNERHLVRAVDLVLEEARTKVGVLGLSFKPGTDDLRESPMVELTERLLGKGYEIKIFDSNVALSRIIGSNRAYITERLPHIDQLLVDDSDSVLDHAAVLVVGSAAPEIVEAIAGVRDDQLIIDLVGLPNADELRRTKRYRGIAW